jgi:hypothetical protein
MKKPLPLPLIAPTAFVRVRPREVRACGRTHVGKGRGCAASRRFPRL